MKKECQTADRILAKLKRETGKYNWQIHIYRHIHTWGRVFWGWLRGGWGLQTSLRGAGRERLPLPSLRLRIPGPGLAFTLRGDVTIIITAYFQVLPLSLMKLDG